MHLNLMKYHISHTISVNPQAFCNAVFNHLRRSMISTLLLFITTPCFSAQVDLYDWLQSNAGKWWDTTPSALRKAILPTPLVWMNREKTKLRYYAGQAKGKNLLTFAGTNICEAVFEFHDKHLNHIFLSLYNRGDAGDIERDDFEDMLSNFEQRLEQLAGFKAEKEQSRIGAVRLYYKNWNNDSGNFNLRWSYSRNRTKIPEYISLTIKPSITDNLAPDTSVNHAGVISYPSADRVKTDKNGNRYLEIPMVDQGAKGYCAVAVLERIMRFYGSNIDQHIFAQMLETSPEAGTQIDSMFKALRRAGEKLGIRSILIYRNDDFSSRTKFKRMITNYNRAARRAKADKLKSKDFYVTIKRHLFCDYRAMAKAIDPEIYKKMRIEEYDREFKQFQEAIITNIDQGIPVAWGVVLGLLCEPGKRPARQGGHMRIINGYNPQNGKIIYTDSWGIGHEFKEISREDAWTITMFAETFVPR